MMINPFTSEKFRHLIRVCRLKQDQNLKLVIRIVEAAIIGLVWKILELMVSLLLR